VGPSRHSHIQLKGLLLKEIGLTANGKEIKVNEFITSFLSYDWS